MDAAMGALEAPLTGRKDLLRGLARAGVAPRASAHANVPGGGDPGAGATRLGAEGSPGRGRDDDDDDDDDDDNDVDDKGKGKGGDDAFGEALRTYLQIFADALCSRAEKIQDEVCQLEVDAYAAAADLNDTRNRFALLSHSQFIQSSVLDEEADEDLASPSTGPTSRVAARPAPSASQIEEMLSEAARAVPIDPNVYQGRTFCPWPPASPRPEDVPKPRQVSVLADEEAPTTSRPQDTVLPVRPHEDASEAVQASTDEQSGEIAKVSETLPAQADVETSSASPGADAKDPTTEVENSQRMPLRDLQRTLAESLSQRAKALAQPKTEPNPIETSTSTSSMPETLPQRKSDRDNAMPGNRLMASPSEKAVFLPQQRNFDSGAPVASPSSLADTNADRTRSSLQELQNSSTRPNITKSDAFAESHALENHNDSSAQAPQEPLSMVSQDDGASQEQTPAGGKPPRPPRETRVSKEAAPKPAPYLMHEHTHDEPPLPAKDASATKRTQQQAHRRKLFASLFDSESEQSEDERGPAEPLQSASARPSFQKSRSLFDSSDEDSS